MSQKYVDFLLRKRRRNPEWICPHAWGPQPTKYQKIFSKLKRKHIILIGACVLSFMVLSWILLSLIPDLEQRRLLTYLDKRLHKRPLTIADFERCRNPELYGYWQSDETFVYQDTALLDIVVHNTETQTSEIILEKQDYMPSTLTESMVRVSKDLKYVLVCLNPIFRKYVFNCKFDGFVVETKKRFTFFNKSLVSYVEFFPNDDHQVFIVSSADSAAYYANSPEENPVPIEPGTINKQFQGIPEPSYEADVVRTGHMVYMAASGSWLMYVSELIGAGSPQNYRISVDLKNGVKVSNSPFALAGHKMPVIRLMIWDKSSSASIEELKIGNENALKTCYFKFGFFNGDNLVVALSSRNGAQSHFFKIEKNKKYKLLYTHTWPNKGWDELYQGAIAAKDGSSLLAVLPTSVPHLTYVTNKTLIYLTPKDMYVAELLAWDEGRAAYILVATESTGRNVYSVMTPGNISSYNAMNGTPAEVRCISCPEKDELWPNCQYVRPIMSPGKKLFVLDCLGPNIPRSWLVDADNRTRIAFLDNRHNIRKLLNEVHPPRHEHETIEIDKTKAHAKLTLPPGFTKNEPVPHSFPMILVIDKYPGQQVADKKWRLDWQEYLASHWRMVILEVDGRGAGYYTMDRIFSVKGSLPEMEAKDQWFVAESLSHSKYYIDSKKLIVVGEDFGGIVALHLASQHSRAIRGVAVFNAKLDPKASWLCPVLGDNVTTFRSPVAAVIRQTLKLTRQTFWLGGLFIDFIESQNMVQAIGFSERYITNDPKRAEDMMSDLNNTYTLITHCSDNFLNPLKTFLRFLYNLDPTLNIHTLLYPLHWNPRKFSSARKHFYLSMVRSMCDKTMKPYYNYNSWEAEIIEHSIEIAF